MQNEFILQKWIHKHINTFTNAITCEWRYMSSGQSCSTSPVPTLRLFTLAIMWNVWSGNCPIDNSYLPRITINTTIIYSITQVRYDCEDRCQHTWFSDFIVMSKQQNNKTTKHHNNIRVKWLRQETYSGGTTDGGGGGNRETTTACCRNSGFPDHSLLACVMVCADWPLQSYLIVKSRFTCSQIWEWPGRPRLCSGESLMRWIRDVLDLIWGRDENNCSRRKKGRDGFVTS